MPAILDVAIGTFFVFMLFSIVVTALNELVLTFFDKRADFLRLGLGELLSDPQKNVVQGYLGKALKYGSADLQWLVAWPCATLLITKFFSTEKDWYQPSCAAGIVAALLAVYALAGRHMKTVVTWINQLWQNFAHPDKKTQTHTADKKITVEKLFAHPLIFSLSKGDSDPSYIRASAFAKAMLDLLEPALNATKSEVTMTALSMDKISAEIAKLKNDKLKTSLAALLRSAEGDVEKFKTALEDWFNHSMERVTGWYKRHAQTWLIILGFILAVVCNVDALRIMRTLSTNPNLAKAVAAQAQTTTTPPSAEVISAARNAKDQKIKEAKDNLEKVTAGTSPQNLVSAKAELDKADTAGRPAAQEQYDKIKKDTLAEAQKEVEHAENWVGVQADFKADLEALSKTGIPMGWDEKMHQEFGLFAKTPTVRFWESLNRPREWNWNVLFPALCGWVLTALAASLGAPFWFDLLQRVMNLRANGRAPDEKALNAKQDDASNPDPATNAIRAAAGAGAAAGAAASGLTQNPPPTKPRTAKAL